MKTQGYKGNRPSSWEVERRYIEGQKKALVKKFERWLRVNSKLEAKGLEPRYSVEQLNELQELIDAKRYPK